MLGLGFRALLVAKAPFQPVFLTFSPPPSSLLSFLP